jgi:hypothetical protein
MPRQPIRSMLLGFATLLIAVSGAAHLIPTRAYGG